jgi:hypothetical protein
MKKLLLPIIFSVLTLNIPNALATDELDEASDEFIQETIVTCKEFAAEDETTPEDLKAYLLECVNGALFDFKFKSIESIEE